VIPVPDRSKDPGIPGWPKLRLKEPDLAQYFNGHQQNIGVLLGEPSNWLVDVDLDHPRCIGLADKFLPPTPAVFGRRSKPRSHRLYYVTGPVSTKIVRSKSAGTLVELRSTGLQTVVAPGTHESGEAIEWEVPDAEPATVDPEQLLAAVQALGNAVKVELGELATPKNGQGNLQRTVTAGVEEQASADRLKLCVTAMLRMGMKDNNDGSGRLFAAACRVVEHDLADADAISAIRAFAAAQPFPRTWADDEILQRVRDAEARCVRGAAIRSELDEVGHVKLGTHDPKSGKLVISPRRTLPTSEAFCREHYSHLDGRTIYSYAGTILTWRGNRWAELEEEAVCKELQPWLHDALRYAINVKTGALELVPFDSNPTTVTAALKSLRSYAHVPVELTPPVWLCGGESAQLDPHELLPFPSGSLHVPTGTVLPPTPLLFNTNAIEFDYDPHPEPPERWIHFLVQLFGDDLESVHLLQEWMGYSLVADTRQQKMLLMVGPRRSGKGTIGRVLTKLVGSGNVVGPTTSSLAGPFGLQPLIGKSLAIVSDARFCGANIGVVVERLLCISGEDALTVDRKFLGGVTMKLPTRFVFLTNELPRMNDASAALAGRFVILRLTESFYGKEDPTLTEKLYAELPGILLWAIDGLKRLRERGYFLQPASVADAVRELEDLASPVRAFARECCIVAPGERAWVDDLYEAWKRWCERDGRTIVTSKQTFGRDLAAAIAGVARRRGSGDVPFYEGIGLKGVV
jgi:putative DNA primase/helicase